MAFRSLKEIVDADINGTSITTSFRKSISVATPTGPWLDLSMVAGNPSPQYYASEPMVANALSMSGDKGLNHGGNVSPSQKILRKALFMASASGGIPTYGIIQDYLLFYPFIAEDTIGAQMLDNTVTLPRYTDGEGVQIMAISRGARTGGALISCSYTNQDGISGRTTVNARMNTNSIDGNIVTASMNNNYAQGPYLTLQDGDTGVRSIESVTMNVEDTGLFTLVLVKPLATFQIREQTAPVEIDFLRDKASMPVIKDDAYLNFIIQSQTSLSGTTIMGLLDFSFN